MLFFYYKALNPNGAKVQGTISALHRFEAIHMLTQKGLHIISLNRIYTIFQKSLSLNEIGQWFISISNFLDQGLPLDTALEMMLLSLDENFSIITNNILQNIRKGYSIAKSISLENIFPISSIALLNTIPQTGNLKAIFYNLGTYYQELEVKQKKIWSQLLYPMCLIAGCLGMFGISIFFFIPSILEMLQELEIEVPYALIMFTQIKHYLINYWLYIIFFIFTSICIIYKLWHKIKHIIPIINNYYLYQDLQFVFYSLHLSLNSKLNLKDALLILKINYAHLYLEEILNSIMQGHSLSRSFIQHNLHPEIKTLQFYEQSGQLNKGCQILYQYYEGQLYQLLTQVSECVYPVILTIITSALLILIYCVFIPVYTTFANLGQEY